MLQVNKNIIFNVLSTLLSLAAPLIVIPYLTNELGMGIYGEYVAIISLLALFSALGDLGLGMYLPKEMSINRNDNSKLMELISSFLIIRLIGSFVMILFSLYLIEGSTLLHVIVILYILIQAISFTLVFTGLEKYQYLSITDLACKILMVIMVLLTDFSYLGLEKAIAIQVTMTVLLNILLLKEFKKCYDVRLGWVCKRSLILILKRSFSFYFVSLLSNIYTQSSTYFVSLVTSSENVALYSIATQLYRIGFAVIGGVVRVMYTSTVKTKDFVTLRKITWLSLCVHLSFTPIVYFFGEHILSLIFDFNTFVLNIMAFILYLTLFFVIVSSYWGYPALSAINKEKYAHLGIIISFFTYALCFMIVYVLGVVNLYSLISCIVISEFVGMIYRLYVINKFKCFFVKIELT